MVEILKHQEAFEYYYSLGEKRNVGAVSVLCRVTVRTVERWSKEFNWQQRVIQRDIEVSKGLEEKTNKTIISEKANYRKIINIAIAEFVGNLRAGNTEVKSVKDLETLVKLDLLLMGEATERKEELNVTIIEKSV